MKLLKIILLFFGLLLPFTLAAAQQNAAYLLIVNGAIGPATQDFIERGLKLAVDQKGEVIILQIDTPGGLDTSMRGIIKAILASPIPVIAYVAPSGARAASAGTYILYASHIAAMAPGTNLGAASPVQIGSESPLPTPDEDKKAKKPSGVMQAKITHDAVAYIKSLAYLRGRNADWGEAAVRQAVSLPAADALKNNVINLIANNVPDLLAKVDGQKLVVDGKQMVLNTKNINVITITPDWRTKLLAVITDPSLAYILLIIGVYGLFFEFLNPGFVLPGVAGAIALLLALYAFQLLPINYTGLALIFLGLTFLIAEAYMPTFGVLGFGGIIAFVVGSILLYDTETTGFSLNWVIIIAMAIVNVVFFIGVIGMVIRVHRRPSVSGAEELLTMEGIALEDFDKVGWIKLHSERWKAVSDTPIKKDQIVVVEKINGLILKVKIKGK